MDSTKPALTSQNLAALLEDPDLRCIVALDTKAAESALTALANTSVPCRPRIIAFDPNDKIFSAIDDGTMEFIRLPNGRRTAFGASGTV